jgi:hypothetical protein
MAPRLHRIADDPVIVEIKLDDTGRGREGSVDGGGFAGPPIKTEIARD